MSLLRKKLKDPAFAARYEQEAVVADVLKGLADEMEIQGVSRAELSRRLGMTRAAVTKFFSGERSPQLRTVVKFAQALDLRVHIELRRKGARPTRAKLPARDPPLPAERTRSCALSARSPSTCGAGQRASMSNRTASNRAFGTWPPSAVEGPTNP